MPQFLFNKNNKTVTINWFSNNLTIGRQQTNEVYGTDSDEEDDDEETDELDDFDTNPNDEESELTKINEIEGESTLYKIAEESLVAEPESEYPSEQVETMPDGNKTLGLDTDEQTPFSVPLLLDVHSKTDISTTSFCEPISIKTDYSVSIDSQQSPQ